MNSPPLRSFATRLAMTYVGAAIVLVFLIGCASTLFMFDLYARTSNEVIVSETRAVKRWLDTDRGRNVPLARMAPGIITDLNRPRAHIAVFDQSHRLLGGRESPLSAPGLVGAIASLMNLKRSQIPVAGGLIVVSPDLEGLEQTLRSYWTLMLPLAAIVIVGAWAAGWAITRTAVAPLRQISVAMRRFAGGDFAPELLRSTRDDEIGELAHSFNGALSQVRSVFAERDRTEAEIRQFIADAGHELRTPLTVIMGYLDILEDAALEAPAIRERVLQTLRQESRRMRSLIEKLIFLARLERGEPTRRELVDVSAVVANVAEALAPVDQAGRLEISTAADARILGDAADIAEAIRNLVDNALKYAPDSPVGVSTAVMDGEVILVVRDEGPGMSEQDQVHAFDRFYRGRDVTDVDGSGLGLAIVKRAVVRSEGTITLESAPGAGTRFTIRLPRAL